MIHDDLPDHPEGEYGAIKIPDAWHVLSLLCFLAALGARFLIALMPGDLRGAFYRPVLTAYSVPVLAAIGVVFGLLGLRNPEGRGTARVALFLNAVVLALGVLALVAFFYILPD